MTTRQRHTGRAASIPSGLAIGTLVSVGITMLSSGTLAKLLDTQRITWENLGYAVMVLLLLASFLGAETAYMRIKRQRLAVCAASGGIYLAVLLAITALFFGGQYEAVGVTALLVLAGSLSAGLLGLRGEKGRGRRKQKYRHR